LFAERGYEHVGVTDVAREAEVAEQTVYNYFRPRSGWSLTARNRFRIADSLTYQAFPEADASALQATAVEIPVQVNGKVRFVVSVPAQADQAETERLLRANSQFAAATSGVVLERVIIVPGRIISLVTGAS